MVQADCLVHEGEQIRQHAVELQDDILILEARRSEEVIDRVNR